MGFQSDNVKSFCQKSNIRGLRLVFSNVMYRKMLLLGVLGFTLRWSTPLEPFGQPGCTLPSWKPKSNIYKGLESQYLTAFWGMLCPLQESHTVL